ncbi:MAG: ABC transporter permease [Bacteroidota bacterium]
MTQFNSVSKFWGLIKALALKIIKLRYKNSILGFLWSMMNPLIYLVIFILVFSHAFPGIDRYPLYALTGLILWTFFSSSTIQVIESIIYNSGVLKSINVPTIAFPLAAQLASLINLFLSLIPFVLLMFLFGLKIGWETLLFFPILLLYTCFTFGTSLILSSFNVYFRDMQFAWSSFMPAIFYSAPIAYTTGLIPDKYLWIIKLNPLYHYIGAVRDVLYNNAVPSLNHFIAITILGLIPLGIGLFIFKKLERGFVSQY